MDISNNIYVFGKTKTRAIQKISNLLLENKEIKRTYYSGEIQYAELNDGTIYKALVPDIYNLCGARYRKAIVDVYLTIKVLNEIIKPHLMMDDIEFFE